MQLRTIKFLMIGKDFRLSTNVPFVLISFRIAISPQLPLPGYAAVDPVWANMYQVAYQTEYS